MLASMPASAWRTLARRLPALRRRAELTAATRAFFTARGYLEVETPCLVPCPGMEPHLDAFRTRYTPKLDDDAQDLFLHTSPEFAMKKLLAGGVGRCFQLARVWRNGEASKQHTPEFTMLEFYAPGMDFSGLMDETEAYLAAMLAIETPFQRLTVAEAFARHAGVPDLLSMADDAERLAGAAGVALRPNETWQDLFLRLLLYRIEPAIGRAAPTFLTHWPASEAALARLVPGDNRVAQRVELFWRGLELANGFVELTNAQEQRARFEAWQAERLARGADPQGWDEDFLDAVAHLPECAGIAIGFDRVAMLAAGVDTIADVQWLPVV